MKYTQQQILELMRCSEDAIYFIAKYIFKSELHPHQIEFLQALEQDRPVIGCFDRQMGKTMMMKGYFLWKALFKGNQALMFVGTQSLNTMHMRHIHDLYESVPDFLRVKVVRKSANELSLETGSTIRCGSVSSASVRGRTINHLWFDECQLYRDHDVQELFQSAIPMMYKGGNITCVGTGEETKKMLQYLPTAVVFEASMRFRGPVQKMSKDAVGRAHNG